MRGFLREGILLLWRWTGVETVMPAEDLGIWPATVGIEEEGGRWMEEEWNMVEKGLRRF